MISTRNFPVSQVETEELIRLRAKLLPPYNVILFNDDYNEMDYVVIVLLHTINRLSQAEAEQIMLTAHLAGNAIVVTCPKETAEFYQERLLSYGLTATIEPE
ncbi:MAG TPA: ATP-dependent Clp protease adaptor ClpS [Ktedonobacteraceae bacterium]|nr:ATP-dependent Clp protease adaptor ClpS [Ktedonobacteraceae bacterium]